MSHTYWLEQSLSVGTQERRAKKGNNNSHFPKWSLKDSFGSYLLLLGIWQEPLLRERVPWSQGAETHWAPLGEKELTMSVNTGRKSCSGIEEALGIGWLLCLAHGQYPLAASCHPSAFCLVCVLCFPIFINRTIHFSLHMSEKAHPNGFSYWYCPWVDISAQGMSHQPDDGQTASGQIPTSGHSVDTCADATHWDFSDPGPIDERYRLKQLLDNAVPGICV